MVLDQGDIRLLNEPLARELLGAPIPARMAYVWTDGTPRVVPMWFHWTGAEVVMVSPPRSPKVKAIQSGAPVALTIDYDAWPARVLMLRGRLRSELVEGEVPEYPVMVRRYLGVEGAEGWRAQYGQMFPNSIRLALMPDWVALLDVANERFPSAWG